MADSPVRPTTNPPTSVGELCNALPITLHSGDESVSVSGVSLATDSVCSGDIFIALPGANRHGAEFAHDAIAAGAVAIITDTHGVGLLGDVTVPIMVTEHPRSLAGQVAAQVYASQSVRPRVCAVTGTNGKTSVSFYLEVIFRQVGHLTALSNSAERQIAGSSYYTKLTTPEAPELHAMLAVAAEKGVEFFSLEASAQAIERHRLDGVRVNVAGFTNLSHDHFEDYGDMERYLAEKLPLFQAERSERAVVSLESPYGRTVVERSGVPTVTVGDSSSAAEWTWQSEGGDGTSERFSLTGPEGTLHTSIKALGRHMISNAALAIVMALEAGVSLSELAAIDIEHGGIDVVVPGRIERVSGGSAVAVFVDAGRSADAYQQTFDNLRERFDGKLIVVCGTSGNRDRSKRAAMGAIAARVADLVIVTDDDPRLEDPAQIRSDLLSGARSVDGAVVNEIADPVDAVAFAVSQATEGDVVVWMGPGSQHYRDVGGVREPFSARDEARKALREAGWSA
jgi:UDP-N-acetylmuramoyl-L-alanyl-D-glutamate--2,6-diaminopimelate ligase